MSIQRVEQDPIPFLILLGLILLTLWLWRDLYNWTRRHGSLDGRSPAMMLGLSDRVWSVVEYVCYPVHVSELQREDWSERRKMALESALDRYKPKKPLPTS